MGVTVLKRKWTQESRTERRNGKNIPVISRDKKKKRNKNNYWKSCRHVGRAVIPKKTRKVWNFLRGELWCLMNRIAAKQRGRKTRRKGWVGSVPQRSPGALESHSQPDVQEDESGGSGGSSRTEGQPRYRRDLLWPSNPVTHGQRRRLGHMTAPDFLPAVWVRVHMWRPVYAARFNQSSWQQRRSELLNRKINDEFPFTPVKKPVNYITGVTCFDLSFVIFSADRSTGFLTFERFLKTDAWKAL